jgi:hypothetical protein
MRPYFYENIRIYVGEAVCFFLPHFAGYIVCVLLTCTPKYMIAISSCLFA